MSYTKHLKQTPQTAPTASEQVKMASGGYAWEADPWAVLNRFLILGSEGGSYYATEQELTLANAQNLIRCLKDDWKRTFNAVFEVYNGNRAPRLNAVLFAMAVMSCQEYAPPEAVTATLGAIPLTLRNSPHLFTWAAYVDDLRGWGRSLRRAVANWYHVQSPEKLAYQLAKYPGRSVGSVTGKKDRWTHKDLMALSHVKAVHEPMATLLAYAVKGAVLGDHAAFDVLKAMAEIRENPASAPANIYEFHLTWEMLPTELLTKSTVWAALVEHMPAHALLRNLANMTRAGLFDHTESLLYVMQKLRDGEWLKRNRVHPLNILLAMNTYASGRGFRGGNSWEPVRQIVDALDDAFYNSIGALESTGRRTLVAVDVSGSMSQTLATMAGMELWALAGAMALFTLRAEPLAEFIAFDTTARPLPVSDKQRLTDVVNLLERTQHGGTDVAAPIERALDKGRVYDLIVIYTDNESWAGKQHAHQAWAEYRRKNPEARLVYCAMAPNHHTLAAPGDSSVLQLIGMDANTPAIIEEFAAGKL